MKFNIIKACGIHTLIFTTFVTLEKGLNMELTGTEILIFGIILFIGSLCATYE